jgi:tetratricopeptide (TPR) repeat protein
MVQSFPSDHRPAQMATTLLALDNRVEEALASARVWRNRQLASPKRASVVIALLQLELDRGDEAVATLEPWAAEIREDPGDDPRVTAVLAEAMASTGDIRGAYELLSPVAGSDALPWEAVLGALEAGSSEVSAYESVLREIDGSGSTDEERFALPMAQAWYRFSLRTGDRSALERAMEYARAVFDASASDRGVLGASVVLAGGSYRLGSTPDAIRYYRRALEIAPDSPDMLNNLAYMLLEEEGDPRESIDLAMRAISINEETNGSSVALRDYYDTLGLAYSRAGQHDRAEEAYRAALDLAPGNNAFRAGLVESLIEQGKLDEAARAFEPLRGLPDDSPLHERVRVLESRLGG